MPAAKAVDADESIVVRHQNFIQNTPNCRSATMNNDSLPSSTSLLSLLFFFFWQVNTIIRPPRPSGLWGDCVLSFFLRARNYYHYYYHFALVSLGTSRLFSAPFALASGLSREQIDVVAFRDVGGGPNPRALPRHQRNPLREKKLSSRGGCALTWTD